MDSGDFLRGESAAPAGRRQASVKFNVERVRADGVTAFAQESGEFFAQLEERHASFDYRKVHRAVHLLGDILLRSNTAGMDAAPGSESQPRLRVQNVAAKLVELIAL